jgi:hypothetical protein
MKKYSIVAACFLVCFVIAGSSAEIYRGIGPLATLGDVKQLFPGATFKKVYPAWAQENDVLYLVTGKGIQGEIVIKFDDNRPIFKRMMEQGTDNNYEDFLRGLAERSDDEALGVSWVRWLPDAPFPVDRMITKYGKPEKSDFSELDFQPFKEWVARGIYAHLTDDGKKVIAIDFSITEKEYKDALKAKYGGGPPAPAERFERVKGE